MKSKKNKTKIKKNKTSKTNQNNTKKRINPNFIKLILVIILSVILTIFIISLFNYEKVISVDVKDDVVNVKLNISDGYCILSTTEPDIEEDNWIKIENNECNIEYIENSNLYIKKNDKIIYQGEGILYSEFTSKNKVYLAIGDNFNMFEYFIGDLNSMIVHSTNEDCVKADGTIINAIDNGETTITIEGTNYSLDVVSTDLITIMPTDGYDYEKDYLECGKYSDEDNELVDEILKDRINDAGYQTRAGVVEAARFLTLEFPYRINYFYENGRQTTNNVDGEGRYYHEGLFLSESKYSSITGSKRGPVYWGCSLYSVPAKRNIDNGLDCSGFVSWALLNGGFDVKDVGAGFSTNSDLTDFGDMKTLTKKIATGNDIKVGDLLHSNAAGGHIAIIVGIKDDYYYVAQALWYDEIGVIISKIKKDKLSSSFSEIIFMDNYYKEDGNYTEYWY